jgi:hypothetical protein
MLNGLVHVPVYCGPRLLAHAASQSGWPLRQPLQGCGRRWHVPQVTGHKARVRTLCSSVGSSPQKCAWSAHQDALSSTHSGASTRGS